MLKMDIYIIVPILIALFSGYTIVAAKYRKWYFKISRFVFPIWYLAFGLFAGYHIAITFLWNKIRSIDQVHYSQYEGIIRAHIPSLSWYVLFAVVMFYMIFLHHIIWRFKYSKKRKRGRSKAKSS
jgi:hypothetical protein